MTINDGGPAFPFGQISEITGQPINGYFAPGMTLRDWFAGQAMREVGWHSDKDKSARLAYEIADAMLRAREVKP